MISARRFELGGRLTPAGLLRAGLKTPVGNTELGSSVNPRARMPALRRSAGILACGFGRHPCRQFRVFKPALSGWPETGGMPSSSFSSSSSSSKGRGSSRTRTTTTKTKSCGSSQTLINTLLQRGVGGGTDSGNRFNDFRLGVETVETVARHARSRTPPLNRIHAVGKRSLALTQRRRGHRAAQSEAGEAHQTGSADWFANLCAPPRSPRLGVKSNPRSTAWVRLKQGVNEQPGRNARSTGEIFGPKTQPRLIRP